MSFALTPPIEGPWFMIAERARDLRRKVGRTVVLGLCGPQGSGKSTGALRIRAALNMLGARSAVLSLDDLYLSKAERARLAARVHPLFATRGPPGTHDVGLGCATLDDLALPGRLRLPLFDKGRDDPAPLAEWPDVATPVDVTIFEGWCVGARPQSHEALAAPVNALEAAEDPQGRWRSEVNRALGGAYQALFDRIDLQILLRPPAFEVVLGWRRQQELALRARSGAGMSDTELARFIQHYERLSRWIDEEMPARSDMVVQLDAARRILSVSDG